MRCNLCLLTYLLVFVGLNVADVLLTLWGLSSGGHEYNPLPSVWKVGSLLLVTASLLVLGRTYPRLATGLAASFCFFYAGVIGWSLAQLLRL